MEKWNETQVDTAADDTRRGKILEIVKPLITSDPAKPVVDVPEVKTLVGDTKICWGCLSQVCRARQYVSQRFMGKKLVNRYCPVRKVVLGDRNIAHSLQSKVSKDNYVAVSEDFIPKKKFDKKNQKRQRKQQFFGNTASIIKKPAKQNQTEQIKRVNLTGLTDDDLFGPAFLYEESECFTEKKSIPANPVQMEHGYPLDKDNYESDYGEDGDNYENDYEEDEDNYEFSCFHCGKVLSDDEEHDHSKKIPVKVNI